MAKIDYNYITKVRENFHIRIRERNSINLDFIHIPKCGGTSFWSWIQSNALTANLTIEPPPHSKADMNLNLNVTGAVHRTFNQYTQKFAALGMDVNDRHFATVLRSPQKSLVSWYNYVKHNCELGSPHKQCSRLLENTKTKVIQQFTDGRQIRFFTRLMNFGEEYNSCCINELDLEDAKNTLLHRFSVVGILEDLEKTLFVFHCRVSWIHNLNFPRLNTDNSNEKLSQEDLTNIDRITSLDNYLYDFARQILEIDYKICTKYSR